jgi:hypothetical protein
VATVLKFRSSGRLKIVGFLMPRRAARPLLPLVFVFLILITICSALSGCSGTGAAQGTTGNPTGVPLTTTTTLQAETSNNSSAADSFVAQGNGNEGAANVSKQSVQQLLYSGSNARVMVSWLPWFGGSNHMDVGYHSDDPAQVHKQVEDMISRGIQGAIIDWFGPNVPIVSNASLLMQKEAEAHSGFQFAIMEDSGALFNSAVANNCDVTSQLISDLTFINSQFVPSPAYMRLNGKAPIFMFGVSQFFIDWTRVLAALPSSDVLIFRGPEGLQQSYAGGAFQWIDINSSDGFDQQLAALNSFYSQAAQAPTRPIVGAAYKGFNDPLAMWGTNRQIHPQCGSTWLASFQETNKFFSSSKQLPALQIVTWNDYEEGSEIESGIDPCTFIVPSASGNTLSWTLGGGSENTVDHFTVFASTDGKNLAKLADVPAGQHSLDLSSFNLPSPVSLFVKAVGQPSIRNLMSSPVVLKAGDAPPKVTLNTSLSADLTVTASTSTSDPDGSIASTTIDFGDGTVNSAASGTHKYASAGTFTVMATVVDNSGASAIAVSRVEVKAAAGGVTILSPANSASVNWPTPIVASANFANPVARINVLIDGQPAFVDNKGVVNSNLKVFVGTHQITVQATDSTGATAQSSVSVVGEPGNLPPTAVLTITPMPSIAANTVLACSVGSHDPDGFILQYKTQFSDGSTFFTPAVVHTLGSPGSFSATASVIDQFGAPSSATQSFSVSAAPASGTASVQNGRAQTRATTRPFEPIRRP